MSTETKHTPNLIRIEQIDYPKSVWLTRRLGRCLSSEDGLHTVLRGTTHCEHCGRIHAMQAEGRE